MFRKYPWVVLAMAIIVARFENAIAQQSSEAPQVDVAAITAQWPDLLTIDFVKEVLDSRAERQKWEPNVLGDYRNAVYEESARRFRSGMQFSAEDLPVLASLADWASEVLAEQEQQQVRNQLLSNIRNSTDASFEALQAAYRGQRALGGPHEERMAMVKEWFSARQMSQLTTDQLLWCVMAMRPHREGAKAGFAVTWTGRITPPRDGEYLFSTCPLAISTTFGNSFYDQWMTVDVNGQRVVDASPEAWNWQGNAITLAGGQSVPIQVTFRYQKNAPWRLAPAILYWQGPGFARSVVPPNVLKQANGQAGLTAEYRWQEPNGEQNRTLVEPNVDWAWTDGSLACNDLELMRTAVNELFDRVTSAEYLAQFGADGRLSIDGQQHPLFRPGSSDYCRALTYSTTAQRGAWIERLINSPNIFVGTDTQHISRLHKSIRAGCEREAVDLVGVWMQQQPNREVRLAATVPDFYKLNRSAYRDLTVGLVWEHPPSIEWLESDYLEDPQGACVLPVAYTVGTAYLVQGKIAEWIAFLDQKLADQALTGDRRVNWLLARAHAEEIRRCPQSRHKISTENLGAGRQWLEEAELVAESPATRLRAAKERLSRLAAHQQWQLWDPQLEETAQRFASDTAAAIEIAAWKTWSDEAKAALQAAHDRQKTGLQASLIREFERRKAEAAERGDAAAVARYTERLQSLQADAEN